MGRTPNSLEEGGVELGLLDSFTSAGAGVVDIARRGIESIGRGEVITDGDLSLGRVWRAALNPHGDNSLQKWFLGTFEDKFQLPFTNQEYPPRVVDALSTAVEQFKDISGRALSQNAAGRQVRETSFRGPAKALIGLIEKPFEQDTQARAEEVEDLINLALPAFKEAEKSSYGDDVYYSDIKRLRRTVDPYLHFLEQSKFNDTVRAVQGRSPLAEGFVVPKGQLLSSFSYQDILDNHADAQTILNSYNSTRAAVPQGQPVPAPRGLLPVVTALKARYAAFSKENIAPNPAAQYLPSVFDSDTEYNKETEQLVREAKRLAEAVEKEGDVPAELKQRLEDAGIQIGLPSLIKLNALEGGIRSQRREQRRANAGRQPITTLANNLFNAPKPTEKLLKKRYTEILLGNLDEKGNLNDSALSALFTSRKDLFTKLGIDTPENISEEDRKRFSDYMKASITNLDLFTQALRESIANLNDKLTLEEKQKRLSLNPTASITKTLDDGEAALLALNPNATPQEKQLFLDKYNRGANIAARINVGAAARISAAGGLEPYSYSTLHRRVGASLGASAPLTVESIAQEVLEPGTRRQQGINNLLDASRVGLAAGFRSASAEILKTGISENVVRPFFGGLLGGDFLKGKPDGSSSNPFYTRPVDGASPVGQVGGLLGGLLNFILPQQFSGNSSGLLGGITSGIGGLFGSAFGGRGQVGGTGATAGGDVGDGLRGGTNASAGVLPSLFAGFRSFIGFNEGGLVIGPAGTDNILAGLSAGEFVINKNQVNKPGNLQLLEAINRGVVGGNQMRSGGINNGNNVQVTINFDKEATKETLSEETREKALDEVATRIGKQIEGQMRGVAREEIVANLRPGGIHSQFSARQGTI